MSKSSSTSAKTAVPLPQQSAWARGPPNASVSSVASSAASRSQSPAPSAPQHSRRSSQHAAIGFGGSTPRTSKPGLSFGTINDPDGDKQSMPPPSTQPLATGTSRTVPTFGSIDATANTIQVNGKAGSVPGQGILPSGPPTVSKTLSTTAAPAAAPSSVPAKPQKVDIKALFRGDAGKDTTQDVPPSPAMNGTPVSSAVPLPHASNAPGPTGPGPHAHPMTSHPQQFAYGPNAMRAQPSNNSRSTSFSRPGQNGAAGRPPVAPGGPAATNSAMASPRLGGPPNHPPLHHHSHQQPPQTMPGMQPQMAWAGYYPYYPGMPPVPAEYMYAPQPWMHMPSPSPHGGTPVNGPPPTPHGHPHGLPVSPRQPPPPLQTPGTPPASVAAPLASAGPRLNTNASAFIPGQGTQPQQRQQSKVKITDASGHEVDFNTTRHKPNAVPSTPSTPLMDTKSGRRAVIRMETEEARQKRIAEENAKKEAEAEATRKKKEEEEAQERKRKEEEEKERQRVEEERLKKEEAERLEREEKERQQKEEEDRKRRVEEERIRKEEEEKARKEKEEQEKKEQEERHRLEEERRKEEEKERLRREEEERLEEERIRKEAEKRRQEEERQKEEATKALQQEKSAALEIRSRKEGIASPITDSPLSASPESHKKRPVPGPLDLSVANKNVVQPLPSALATARHIQDVYQIQYPEGIKSPKPELNTNAKDGKFRYDRDFLLQFMLVCKEKPDNLPPLEAIGLEPSDQMHSMGRTSSGRRGISGGMPSSGQRQASVGLGFVNPMGKSGSGFMGSFATSKLSSEERFMRSTSLSGGPSGFGAQSGRNSPMVRSSSQGGPGGMGAGGMGSKRTRSKRGEARNEANRMNAAAAAAAASAMLEPVAPLEVSANRWTIRRNAQDQDSPEVVDRKVRALLNKLTMERFDSISDQIIVWANKSEKETDGRTLIQVIRLVFEKATDEATWSEMYARLCRKMMEQISPNVQDDGIRNAEGRPITGGLLFRKYLLNRCQEDFERGWAAKDSTAAAAKAKASEDQAVKEANEKSKEKENNGDEVQLYSEEYYAAQKAKRQGLGLVKFIGELYKLQMLTERIMHECIKKLLSNVDNPEEEEIESLCKLLTTVGQALDTPKARGHMDVYFSRMKELAKSTNVTIRMQFMLRDVIELRERKWQSRSQVAAPQTIQQLHEAASKERMQQEREALNRSSMSRGGSRRGHDREAQQVGPDGWAVASGTARPGNKAGDLSHFGKISKAAAGPMQFGPTSVFSSKKDGNKRESSQLSRPTSSQNMFSMLEGNGETPVPPSRGSRPPSRTASVDLGSPAESGQRPRLNLLPRTKPVAEKGEGAASAGDDEVEEGEIPEGGASKTSSMPKEQAERKIDNDVKEFFAIRNLDEAEDYFTALPAEFHALLVEKLVMRAIESKQTDAQLVADCLNRTRSKNQCSPDSLEQGFLPTAEILDDIAIDAPKAFDLMAIMVKGANLDKDAQSRIAQKVSDNSEKLLKLLA